MPLLSKLQTKKKALYSQRTFFVTSTINCLSGYGDIDVNASVMAFSPTTA